MDNNMFKTILNESIDFIDSELTIYNYLKYAHLKHF